MLWHPQTGPLLAGSIARYFQMEKNNMQHYPEDHPLTPRIEIHKRQGRVLIEANAPLRIQEITRPRIFNLVPGFEAVPVIVEIPDNSRHECRIRFLHP